MVRIDTAPSPERVAIIQWTARLGAVTAEALAALLQGSVASARAKLGILERAGWLLRTRPLVCRPALYTATKAGLRASALPGLEPCRVTASNANHLILSALAAAVLARDYPEHRVWGERELRQRERERGMALASACLGAGPNGGSLLHRPDLVLWPPYGESQENELPVAVEVELTVKAPRRLADICAAWARCRCVAGVLYLAAPEVRHALSRAIAQAQAGEVIVVLPLGVLTETHLADAVAESPTANEIAAAERNVPSDA